MSKSVEVEKLLNYDTMLVSLGGITHAVDEAIYWEPLMMSVWKGTKKTLHKYCEEIV